MPPPAAAVRTARPDPAQAAEGLAKDSRAGRLNADAVTAVLEVAGQRRPRRRTDLRPLGLSEREIEVLRLIAHGCSNHQNAERFVIYAAPPDTTCSTIYTTIGNSSRPAAAVFALEHDPLNCASSAIDRIAPGQTPGRRSLRSGSGLRRPPGSTEGRIAHSCATPSPRTRANRATASA